MAGTVTLRTVAVVVLAALAGCSGLAPASTPTETPAPVPTDAPPTDVPTREPGSVRLASRLADTHETRLAGTAYTVHENRTARYVNGSLRAQRLVTTRVSAANRTHRVVRLDGPAATHPLFPGATRVETYTEGRVRYAVGWRDGEPRYASLPVTRDGSSELSLLLLSFDLRTEQVVRNGTNVTRVESTGLADRYFLESAEGVVGGRVREATFAALVGPDGLVSRYRVHYRLRVDGALVVVTHRVAYTGVGNTTVSRPEWYDEAVQRAE